jgi:hypothetical protein
VDARVALHHHVVLPRVAEVVLVDKTSLVFQHLENLHGGLVQLVDGVGIELGAIGQVPHPEAVRVRVRPAHGRLENQVELVQPCTAGYQQPTPDDGVHPVQLGTQLEHAVTWRLRHTEDYAVTPGSWERLKIYESGPP